MCGIAGFISFTDKKVNKLELKAMTDIVAHRGPDGEGHYFSKDGSIGLGHRRLSIIDLTDSASQPMTFDDHTIVFNGEIYNYIEIREELKALGRTFITASDTEVIIRAYQQWGDACVHKFNGMWAFAIHDVKKCVVFCSRDRFGIKPFYFYENNGCFYFGSEIKEFTVLENWSPIQNSERVYEYLLYGYQDHTNETFFKGVQKLPQGSHLIFDLNNQKFRIERYYDLSVKKIEVKDYVKEFKLLFENAVSLRLRADVKAGTALSGGIDSTAVVCTVNELLKEKKLERLQETVSAVYEENFFDESIFIDSVVDKLDIINHKVSLSFKEVMEKLNSTIWHMDEPFGSMSMIASRNVFEMAQAKDIKVMLNGQGADEILGGYNKFYKIHIEDLLKRGKIFTAIGEFISFKMKHSISIFTSINAVLKYTNKFIKSPNKTWLKNKHLDQSKLYKRRAENAFFDVSYNLVYSIGMPALLHYEDRNSMTSSVEARVPFLDYKLVEYCVSLPNDVKIKHGVRKNVVREAMKNVFPKLVYKRYDKLGFVTPQEFWMVENRNELKDEIFKVLNSDFKEVIDDKQLLELFETEFTSNMSLFWRVIVYKRWLNVFKVE